MLLKRSLLLVCVLVGVVSLSACNQRSSTDDASSAPAQSSVTSGDSSTDDSAAATDAAATDATATDADATDADATDDSSDANDDSSDADADDARPAAIGKLLILLTCTLDRFSPKILSTHFAMRGNILKFCSPLTINSSSDK